MVDGEIRTIESAIRGESEAFGLLYDKYQPQIYRFIYLKVGHREEAEDLTHQVFVNAWQNIHKYQIRSFPFTSWLYRIARNQVIDYYRAYKGNREQNLESVAELKTETTLELTLDTSLTFQKVKAAMAKLHPDYQDILIMRYTEDLSLRETAAALEKSIGAVKVAQHRAIANLKKLLNDSNESIA